MNRILLLGGSGILSTEICRLAIDQGNQVTMINRGTRKKQINPQAELIVFDLKKGNMEQLRQILLEQEPFDIVVDFISYHVGQLKRNLELVGDRCKQYIFISTATVYLEKKDSTPFTEDDAVGDTGWQYARDKVACEEYLRASKAKYQFEETIVRPYVTYGETRIPYQITPLEYYTLINRILLGKPVPVFGDNRCTLTFAADFAVGVTGLFQNPAAYGEAVHITSDERFTWTEVLETLGQKLEREVISVSLPPSILERGSLRLGFDADEIRYDKGRNMIFCNDKIKRLVPEFQAAVPFAEGIEQTLSYYQRYEAARKINYAWDARIDRLLARFAAKEQRKQLRRRAYGKQLTFRNQMVYIVNRYDLFYFPAKIIHKLWYKVRKKSGS